MKKHFLVQIYGQVQGIFFRSTTKEQADNLKLTGFAKNMPDGSVYIEAEGEKKDLDNFIKWCNAGPPMARVEKVIVTEDKLKNFSKFETY